MSTVLSSLSYEIRSSPEYLTLRIFAFEQLGEDVGLSISTNSVLVFSNAGLIELIALPAPIASCQAEVRLDTCCLTMEAPLEAGREADNPCNR